MIENAQMTGRFKVLRQQVRQRKPLIHCITHPITINDCANLVLAVGARPVMAEHPDEAAEITASADALAVNLGNITAARLEAMRRSGAAARSCGIPVLLDLVGVTCSQLRYDFARQFIENARPCIIKGNISEVRLMCGLPVHASGVDAGAEDQFTEAGRVSLEQALRAYAREQQAVVMASGAVDLIADSRTVSGVTNGTPRLAELTGTGCMLGVLAAVYLSAGQPRDAALLAALTMGIAGEHAAAAAAGPGSFHVALLDALAALPDAAIAAEGHLNGC